MPRPIGVRQGRKGGNQQPNHASASGTDSQFTPAAGNQQPNHASGSALHVMHVVHASGTEQQAACADAADTTIFVDIGAHHSGNRACGQQLAEHLMAGTAVLQWHGRSACADAVRAAISSPFTPAAPHCT